MRRIFVMLFVLAALVQPARADRTWDEVPVMGGARVLVHAVALEDGRVLVVSGLNQALTEVFDPAQNRWVTSEPSPGRDPDTATLLADGRVLVTFGDADPSAAIFDSATLTWTQAAPMRLQRIGAAAVRLLDGRVLVAGGEAHDGRMNPTPVHSAEIYEPTSNTWRETGEMNAARQSHTSTMLPDGRVLVTGGKGRSSDELASTEMYLPDQEIWLPWIDLEVGRYHHTASLLPNGRILVVGGTTGEQLGLPSSPLGFQEVPAPAEIYEPQLEAWTLTRPMVHSRFDMTSTSLNDGRVLVAGGRKRTPFVDESFELEAEIFDPGSETWSVAGMMHTARRLADSALLPDGRVIVIGGQNDETIALPSAETYRP